MSPRTAGTASTTLRTTASLLVGLLVATSVVVVAVSATQYNIPWLLAAVLTVPLYVTVYFTSVLSTRWLAAHADESRDIDRQREYEYEERAMRAANRSHRFAAEPVTEQNLEALISKYLWTRDEHARAGEIAAVCADSGWGRNGVYSELTRLRRERRVAYDEPLGDETEVRLIGREQRREDE